MAFFVHSCACRQLDGGFHHSLFIAVINRAVYRSQLLHTRYAVLVSVGCCRTRGQKRKFEEPEPGTETDDHGSFDPTALKEHEEFTKVKNVERIELGEFEMDTWYFSPLPEEYRECQVCANLLIAIYRLQQTVLFALKAI